MLKVFQPLTTPVGTNEQQGVGEATVTVSGAFRARGIAAGADRGLFLLNVSATSGTTPSLTVTIQGRDPGSLKWVDIDTFGAQTTVTASPLALPIDPLYFQSIRVAYAVSGTTPSFTFSCGVLLLSSESPLK